MTRAIDSAAPLRTWRIEEGRYSNGNPSGTLHLVADYAGEVVELATITRWAGDVTAEEIAATITDALDALRRERGIK